MTAAMVSGAVGLFLFTLHIWRIRDVIRAGVLLVLRVRKLDWVRGFELYEAFGPQVYGVLHKLCEEGRIEMASTAGTIERGDREGRSYRWAHPGGR